MKKLVYSASRDEILKEKEQHEAKRKAALDRREEMNTKYLIDKQESLSVVQDYMLNFIDKYPSLNLSFRVDYGYNYNKSGMPRSVHINLNNEQSAVSLSWNFDINVDIETGEVTMNSGSWSNMTVTNPEQAENLMTCAKCLQELVSTDWSFASNVKEPNKEDYYVEVPENRDFNIELAMAELSEAVGTDKIFQGKDICNKLSPMTVYFIVTAESEKSYTVHAVSISYADYLTQNDKVDSVYDMLIDDTYYEEARIKKQQLAKQVNLY